MPVFYISPVVTEYFRNKTTPLALFMTIKLQCFVAVLVDKRMRRYEYGYCCTDKEIMGLVPGWTIG